MEQSIARSLPHSLEAEQGLLGSIMISSSGLMGDCVEQVDASDFHVPAHQKIYEALSDLWSESKPVDFVTLTQKLTDSGDLDMVGGAAFITQLFNHTPTAANASHYIKIIQEKATLRKIIQTCTQFAARGYEQEDPATLLSEVEQGILAINRGASEDQYTLDAKQLAERGIAAIEQKITRKGFNGQTTGLRDLDELLDGLKPAEMSVWAARPSGGKSALLMQLAEHAALDCDQRVLFFSAEMSASNLMERQIASRARVSIHGRRDNNISQADMEGLLRAAKEIAQSKIQANDKPAMSINYICAVARREHRRHPVSLICVDYMQKVKGSTKRSRDSRRDEVAEVSGALKDLAKELGCHVAVAAQINREGVQNGRKPTMGALKECSDIEQDADVIGLIYRPEQTAEDEFRGSLATVAEIKIDKNRNGPTSGWEKFTFLKDCTRFVPYSKRDDA